MNKTKRISIMALSAALAACSVASIPASAYVPNDDYKFAYRICENGTNESTIYVDKDDLANGDYVVNTAIYIETDESPTDLVHAHASWNGYDINNEVTKYITFDNCSAYSDSNDLLTTDAYFAALEDSEIIDGVNITSTFAPSCFSGMRERSSGIQLTHWFSGPSNVYKSVNVKQDGTAGTTKGTTIYSAGPNKVYFDIESRGERVYIDLEYDEKTGTAVGEYSYTWTFSQRSTVKQHVESETIHIYHYDPDTPVDEPIKVVKTSVDLHGLSGNQIDEWYGGSSDYLPFTTFDTVIDKDTPEGTYYVAFKPNGANSLLTMGWEAVSTSIEDESYWLKIVVGDSAEAEEAAYDVNLDGTVGVDDATEVLSIYAETAAGIESPAQILQAGNVNADVDGDGEVTLSDATAILTKYAEDAAGL